jgi:hypothetical protein
MEADREYCNAVAIQRGTRLFHMATIVFFRPPQMTDIRHVEAALIPSPIVLDSSCAGLRIHRKKAPHSSRWIAGASPAMTADGSVPSLWYYSTCGASGQINNNIGSACPWADAVRAHGNTGSDCKIRDCRRSPPARTFPRSANCNCRKMYRRLYSCPRTTELGRLGWRERRTALPLPRPLR